AQEVTGMVFQPFSEVQGELSTVTQAPVTDSYARVEYHIECEAAINEQINIEYTISYVYHALHSYFARDNVGLPGFAKFFKEASDEEREHAHMLMDYQTKRGGRVELKPLAAPEMEFANDDKGEALYAMELALSLEKLNFQKLQALQAIADKHKDAALCDFVEGGLLSEQVDAVKEHAVYVSQLRRVGKGVGVYLLDQELGEEEA
nr:Chain A, ferritin [Ulva pertusa]